jgi:hypothetical protein
MRTEIRATKCKGRELQPGDLFSTAGPEYWSRWDSRGSVGECVYIRTNVPASEFPDADEDIYRIEVLRGEN